MHIRIENTQELEVTVHRCTTELINEIILKNPNANILHGKDDWGKAYKIVTVYLPSVEVTYYEIATN